MFFSFFLSDIPENIKDLIGVTEVIKTDDTITATVTDRGGGHHHVLVHAPVPVADHGPVRADVAGAVVVEESHRDARGPS